MQDLPELLSKPEVIWFLIGLFFLLAELVIPGLIILFFGIGCWVTAGALLFFPELSLNEQLLIFLASSVISLALLRRSLKKWIARSEKSRDEELEEYLGKQCVVTVKISPGHSGKVDFRGAQWEASSSSTVQKGQHVVIKKVEGIHLTVEPI